MKVVASPLSAIAAVHVVGARDGPLAIVERLLCARHHLTQQRPAHDIVRYDAVYNECSSSFSDFHHQSL